MSCPKHARRQGESGLASRPFWDDEAGYVLKDMVSDSDLQEAFVARSYVLQASVGLGRFYWYQWDTPTAGLQGKPDGAGEPEIAQWLAGASISACTVSGTVYSCPLTSAGGVPEEIEWDTSQTCGGGSCNTVPASVIGFGRSVDLTGATSTILNEMVPLGAKPVLLQP